MEEQGDVNANSEQNMLKDVFQSIQAGQKRERSLKDLCCFITFILIVLATFIIGVAVMSSQKQTFSQSNPKNKQNLLRSISTSYIEYRGLITLSYFLVILLSYGLLAALSNFSKCMTYVLISLPFLMLIALIVLGYLYGLAFAILTSILFFICLFNLYHCLPILEKIKDLFQIASNFMRERSYVMVSSFWVFLWTLPFIFFWSMSTIAITFSSNIQKSITSNEKALLCAFIFIYIFMTIFFTYVRIFIVTTAAYKWFHNQNDFFRQAITNINKYHIGSITFGALIAIVLNIVRFLFFNNLMMKVYSCFQSVQQLTKKADSFLASLSSISIVVMSITGQSYYESSKIAKYIISSNMELFRTISILNATALIGGTIISTGIPAFIAIMYSYQVDRNISEVERQAIGCIIFFGAIILCTSFISISSDVVQTLFIISCLHDNFNMRQIKITAPDIINKFPIIRRHQAEPDNAMPSVHTFIPNDQMQSRSNSKIYKQQNQRDNQNIIHESIEKIV